MLGRSPALLPLLCLIAAVFIADAFQFSAWLWWGAALLTVVAAFSVHRRLSQTATWGVSLPGILFSIALASASAGYYQAAIIDRSQTGIPEEYFNKREFRLYGEVRGWPKISRDRTELVVDLDSISGNQSSVQYSFHVHATIQVIIGDTTTFVQHGDRVQLIGVLREVTPSGGRLAYHRYLERQGIQSQVYLNSMIETLRIPQPQDIWFTTARVLREQLVASLKKVLPQAEASLAAGFLVGETRDLPQQTMLLFRETGTLHLLAVSGANVWLMVGFLLLVLRPVPIGRLSRTIIIIALLIVFMLMCYAEPSVVRATILAILVLIGRLVGRKLDLLHLIAVAALLMLLITPWQLFSIGFQLSFLTATALVATMLPFQEMLEERRLPRWMQGILLGVAGSVVASLISAPLVWWYFERISVTSIPANIVIAPLVSISTLGSLAAATIYQLLPPVGVWIGALAHFPLDWLMKIVEWFGFVGDDIRVLITDETLATVLVFTFYLVAASLLVTEAKRRLFVTAVILLSSIATFAGISIARQRGSVYQMIVEPIPGGTIVAITRDRWQTADLLISGLRSRRYPVDSVVIIPFLERIGINTVATLAVKDIEYSAIDDVLRLANSVRAGTLLIPNDERHAFQDWRDIEKKFSGSKMLISPGVSNSLSTGIFVDAEGLSWLDSLMHFNASRTGSSTGLQQKNSAWTIRLLSSADSSVLRNPDYDLLLCAGFEQRNRLPDQLKPPNLVIDLSRTGGIRLYFSDKLIIQSSGGETIFRKRTNAR